jgi:hypothetical protein
MRFRKLRIAWSVFWGVACVLLIVLWTRSYWREDCLYWNIVGHRSIVIASARGQLAACTFLFEMSPGLHPRFRLLDDLSYGHTDVYSLVHSDKTFAILGPDSLGPVGRALLIPHWLAVLIFGGIAILGVRGPFQFRFTLRTLLIATTLVAVMLGLIVWLR